MQIRQHILFREESDPCVYSNHAWPLISRDHYVNYPRPGRNKISTSFSKSGADGKVINIHGTKRSGEGIVSRASSRARKTVTRDVDIKKTPRKWGRAFTLVEAFRGQTIKKCVRLSFSLFLSSSFVSR